MDRLLLGPRISRTSAAMARFIHTYGYKTRLVKLLQTYSRTDCSINRHFENEKGQLCCPSLSRLFWNDQVRARMGFMPAICQKRGVPNTVKNRWKSETVDRVLSSVLRCLDSAMKHEARVNWHVVSNESIRNNAETCFFWYCIAPMSCVNQ